MFSICSVLFSLIDPLWQRRYPPVVTLWKPWPIEFDTQAELPMLKPPVAHKVLGLGREAGRNQMKTSKVYGAVTVDESE